MALVHLLERNVAGPICMGRGRNTDIVAETAHGYIGDYVELDLPTKWYHLVELWENLLL